MSNIFEDEHVVHLLEEAEKAMRLWEAVKGDDNTEPDVRAVVDSLFRDLGRVVYNRYWEEPLEEGEEGAALALITSEEPTEDVGVEPDSEEAPPGFGRRDLTGSANEATGGWYTQEVERPHKPLFTPEDGLEEALPESDPDDL